MQLALGLIETKGLIGAIEAADAGTKAANVKLIAKEYATGALVLIKFEGEVAAVKSAVEAASAAAQRVGQLVSAHVIPRPDDQIDPIVYEIPVSPKETSSKKSGRKSFKKAKALEENSTLFDSQDEVKEEILEEDETEKEGPEVEAVEVNEADEEIEEPEIVDEVEVEIQEEAEGREEEPSKELKAKTTIPPMDELEILNVHQLRKLARSYDGFPIKGRDISKANRGTLLDYFKSM